MAHFVTRRLVYVCARVHMCVCVGGGSIVYHSRTFEMVAVLTEDFLCRILRDLKYFAALELGRRVCR